MNKFLHTRLLWILSGLVPLMAYTVGILWLFVLQQDHAIKQLINEAANNTAHIVERTIGEQIGILTSLSTSRFLDNGNFLDFRIDAQRLWDMHPEWRTIIITNEKSPLLNLYFPAGKPIPPLRDSESLKIVWDTIVPVK